MVEAPVSARAKRPERRADRRCRKPAPRHARPRRVAAARRRGNALSAVLGLTACPTFLAGLYAVQDQGDARYGAVGTVLAVALLWASERAGRWLP